MIDPLAIAMSQGIGLGSIANRFHPDPTLAEAVRKVGDLYNKNRLIPFLATLMKNIVFRQR